MVALVDHKNVGNFHDAGFNGLHVVAHAGDKNHDGDVGDADNVNLILANADGFDHHDVATGGIEHSGHIGSCAGEPAERAARGHTANVNAGVGEVVLHANAVAENRTAGVRAGGIDGDDADAIP